MALLQIPSLLENPYLTHIRSAGVPIWTEEQAKKRGITPKTIVSIGLMPQEKNTHLKSQRDFAITMGNNTQHATKFVSVNLRIERHEEDKSATIHFPESGVDLEILQKLRHAGQYDGVCISGASIDDLEYENIEGLDELNNYVTLAHENTFGRQATCWAAMNILNKESSIPKHMAERDKIIGIFNLHLESDSPLIRDWDTSIGCPGARVAYIKDSDIRDNPRFEVLARAKDMRSDSSIMVVFDRATNTLLKAGHDEYSAQSVWQEHLRDLEKGGQGDILPGRFVGEQPAKGTIIGPWAKSSAALNAAWQSTLTPEAKAKAIAMPIENYTLPYTAANDSAGQTRQIPEESGQHI